MCASFDNIDIRIKKNNIRKITINKLKTFDRKAEESRAIVELLKEKDYFHRFDSILAFYPLRTEPDITPLFNDEMVAFPYIENDTMFFSKAGPLEKSKLGFLEPKHIPIGIDNALMLVPLVAFDDDNYRLGRGGGFYDRFIKEHRDKLYTVGIAYSISRIDKVPREPFDERLDEIICPKCCT